MKLLTGCGWVTVTGAIGETRMVPQFQYKSNWQRFSNNTFNLSLKEIDFKAKLPKLILFHH